MSNFSFSFAGDDIEEDLSHQPSKHQAAETGTLQRSTPAFPISGQASLPATHHSLTTLLSTLPSKISYSTLSVKLDNGSLLHLPRRELWDVRVQLMAEEDDEGLGNLGKDDVKTGVYEGGFKSWESAVDLVRVLGGRKNDGREGRRKFLELGCGTALPSLATFQWYLQSKATSGLDLGLADYNPTVLQLVTLPNLLLSWALSASASPSSWESESELEITPELLTSFTESLATQNITISFFSGSWSPSFITLVTSHLNTPSSNLTIVGAETIYSPAALRSFAETLIGLVEVAGDEVKMALVAAKLVYFGVGGSMEDFCQFVRERGLSVERIREESDGVRRATVEVKMAGS